MMKTIEEIAKISIPAPLRGASHLWPDARRQTYFNTSPSTRGFGRSLNMDTREIHFNTSPSTRGFRKQPSTPRHWKFQYQPLYEGLRTRPASRSPLIISIPAPLRGASIFGAEDGSEDTFQYQPLYEGLRDCGPDTLERPISIPAPLRGASVLRSMIPLHLLFQYQPLYEGLHVRLDHVILVIFQYQPLYEGLPNRYVATGIRAISIPAPLRGASLSTKAEHRFQVIFQYQPLYEGLQFINLVPCRFCDFNTSPSTRGFITLVNDHGCGLDFNTSPSTRGFPADGSPTESDHISIPAPLRGASAMDLFSPSPTVFQYQPLYEGLPGKWINPVIGTISIPAPLRGASLVNDVSNSLFISIPAPLRGASCLMQKCRQFFLFQYQPLYEGLPPAAATALWTISISIPAPLRGASKNPALASAKSKFQYQPLYEGLPSLSCSLSWHSYFNTSPSTRGFALAGIAFAESIFQYQPLYEGLRGVRRN